MGKRRSSTDDPISDRMKEGSSGLTEAEEPINPIQTTTIPVVKTGAKNAPAAETGLLPTLDFSRFEGQADENAQDASRTTAETQAAPFPQKSRDTMPSNAPAVLIIEDTTELAEVIQATLERMNLTTVYETHAARALNRFEELQPRVVLLDIGLPDMSGWKFLEAIKEKHKDQLPIIIVITAYGDPANRLVGKFQGVHDYLIKPFTPDEVERVVMGALNSKTA
jgi:CheY-like chemotaxis protein